MNKKGFTLIELIATVVLISLMTLVIVPTVGKIIKKSSAYADKQLEENILLSAKNWAVDNKNLINKVNCGSKKIVWIKDELQAQGYLDNNIVIPSTGKPFTKECLAITKICNASTGKFYHKYNYINSAECLASLDLTLTAITQPSEKPYNNDGDGEWTNENVLLTASSTEVQKPYKWIENDSELTNENETYLVNVAANTTKNTTYVISGQRKGKTITSPPFKVMIDKTVPTITAVTKISTSNNLTITLSDTGSGTDKYAVTNSTATPTSWSNYTNAVTLTKTTGTYYVHAKDKVGNVTYKQVNIQAYNKPTCTITLSGTVGTNDWYRSNVTVNMAVTNTPTSKGLATTANSTNDKTSVSHTTDATSVTYYGYVSNPAGSNTCSKTFKLDKTNSAITVTSKPAATNNLIFSLKDTTSGPAGYAVTNSTATPTSWSNYSKEVTLTKATGTYYVHAKDKAGNTNYSAVTVTQYTKPTCTITLSGTVGTNSWYKSNVTVNMTVTNNPTSKGLATTANSTNGKTSISHTTDTKSVTYYGYVSNPAGSNTCSKTFKLDKTNPGTPGITLTHSYDSSAAQGSKAIVYSNNTWINKTVYMTDARKSPFTGPTASDATSGIARYEISTDNKTWKTYSYDYNNNLYVINSDGTHNRYFRAVDNAGNISGVATRTVKRDTQKPNTPTLTMTHSYSSTAAQGKKATVYTNNTWIKKNVFMTDARKSPFTGPTASDKGSSGISYYQISTNNSSWSKYSYDSSKELYKLTTEGTHKRYFRAVDNAGNISAVLTKTIKIDKTAPKFGETWSKTVTSDETGGHRWGIYLTDNLSGFSPLVSGSSDSWYCYAEGRCDTYGDKNWYWCSRGWFKTKTPIDNLNKGETKKSLLWYGTNVCCSKKVKAKYKICDVAENCNTVEKSYSYSKFNCNF